MNTKSERFEMRLDQSILENVDNWRAEQADLPSRAEAIRRLVDIALQTQTSKPNRKVSISDGEKLILGMLKDMLEPKKERRELDPEFISNAILGGHLWALKWKYSGIFHDYIDNEQTLDDVLNILDMWSFIEEGFADFSQEEKKKFQNETKFSEAKFLGFDGNNESEHMGIARFLVMDMGRFSKFKGRDFNSHCPMLQGYLKMYKSFDLTRASLIGRKLSCDEIINLYKLKFGN